MLFYVNWIIYCLIGCVIFKLFESLLLSKKLNGVDSLPGPLSLPFIGTTCLFIFSKKHPLSVIEDMLTTYPVMEKPIKFKLGPHLVIVIARPDDIQNVLTSANAIQKAPLLYSFVKIFFGDGVLTAPVDIWKRHRKIINTLFRQNISNLSVATFEKHSNVLVDRLKKKVGEPEFHIMHLIIQCALDLICDSVIGTTFPRDPDHAGVPPFINAVGRLLNTRNKRMGSIWLQSKILSKISGQDQLESEYKETAFAFTKTVIEEKLNAYNAKDPHMVEDEEIEQKSVLDQIIDLTQRDDETYKWAFEEVRDEVNTLLIAGSETTASTISFALMMLGIYPKVQEKVVEELKSIFEDTKRVIALEDLRRMEYLERVIKETLRIFPAVPLIARATTGDVKLDSCTIPKDTTIFINFRKTHTDSGLWGEDAHEFEPDRFLPDRSTSRHPFAFIPFSGGSRNCIGYRYAMMQMKYLLATIFRHYVIRCSRKMEDIDIRSGFTLKPAKGYMVSVHRRTPTI